MAVREDTLNVELARLLREQERLDARAEAGAGGKWLDVDVNVDGLQVAIEAKLDFKKRLQARRAADSRLKSLRNVAVALCYPTGGQPKCRCPATRSLGRSAPATAPATTGRPAMWRSWRSRCAPPQRALKT